MLLGCSNKELQGTGLVGYVYVDAFRFFSPAESFVRTFSAETNHFSKVVHCCQIFRASNKTLVQI